MRFRSYELKRNPSVPSTWPLARVLGRHRARPSRCVCLSVCLSVSPSTQMRLQDINSSRGGTKTHTHTCQPLPVCLLVCLAVFSPYLLVLSVSLLLLCPMFSTLVVCLSICLSALC